MIGGRRSYDATKWDNTIHETRSSTKRKWNVVDHDHGLNGNGTKIIVKVAEVERGKGDVADHESKMQTRFVPIFLKQIIIHIIFII